MKNLVAATVIASLFGLGHVIGADLKLFSGILFLIGACESIHWIRKNKRNDYAEA